MVGELHLLARRSSEQQLRQLHPKLRCRGWRWRDVAGLVIRMMTTVHQEGPATHIVLRRLIPRAHCEQRSTITVGDEPEGLVERRVAVSGGRCATGGGWVSGGRVIGRLCRPELTWLIVFFCTDSMSL